jgi:DNA-binding transcriptional ArsR family regulator
VAVQESKKKQKFAPGVNEKVFKVLSHPLRGHIFILLRERVAAPSELAELLGEQVEKVAYHCRQMAKPDIGVIELVATDNRHGGTKHYYRATARPLLDTEEWAEIPKPVRELETTRSAQLVVSDLSAAIKEGTFDSHDARSLLRSPMVIDSQGIHESAEVMMEALDKHSDIQARASQRLAESGEEGTNFRAILLAFPMPSRP